MQLLRQTLRERTRTRSTRAAFLVIFGLCVSACTPSGPSASPQAGLPVRRMDRTLVAEVRVEPESLATRAILGGAFASFALSRRLFNADLTLLDDRLVRHPYLARDLPRLHSDTWRAFPDGRMETRWTLKANLFWHDGAPLSAEDFVFAWRVHSTPELGASGSPLMRAIEEVEAADDRTVVMRWRQPYPYADDLTGSDGLPPLPRHVLDSSFEQSDPNAFARNPYWTREYVGLGPYRLERWEPGSFLEGTAFDQHVLGRPKIGRVKVAFVNDENTAMANLLAGQADLAADNSIALEQAYTLKRDWTGSGSVLNTSFTWRHMAFQLRPDLASPRAVLDQRVRRAVAHAIDKQAINDNVFHSQMTLSEFFVSPQSRWGPALAGAVRAYPYDLSRSEGLMTEAGFTRGADGTYASPADGRFTAELKTTVGWQAEVAAMASELRKVGFDIKDAVLPAALSTDPASRVTFPAMFTSITPQGEGTLSSYTTAQIPRVENNWRGGSNRGGWSNAEYDQLVGAFTRTLEPSARAEQMARMAQIFTEELPIIPLFFRAVPFAYVSALRGPVQVAPEGDVPWNVHQWYWAQ